MADLSPDLAARLRKLLPRLASDHEGEILTTVRAIRRVLDRAELDLHDLARRLAAPEPVLAATTEPEVSGDDLLFSMASWLEATRLDELTMNQRKFVHTAVRILKAGHRLSDAQQNWLAALAAQHGFDA